MWKQGNDRLEFPGLNCSVLHIMMVRSHIQIEALTFKCGWLMRMEMPACSLHAASMQAAYMRHAGCIHVIAAPADMYPAIQKIHQDNLLNSVTSDGTGCEFKSWQCRMNIISYVHGFIEPIRLLGFLWFVVTKIVS